MITDRLTPGKKIHLINTLSRTLPTKVNNTRRVPNIQLKKRTECNNNKIEDDANILSTCITNHGLISKRHNFVVNKIVKELLKNHPQTKVFRERVWRSEKELLGLDMTLIDNKQCKTIEVTIPCEVSNSYLQQMRMEKKRIYKRLTQSTELTQVECIEGEVIPIVIGAFGTMIQDTVNDLKKLKLHIQKDAQQKTVAMGRCKRIECTLQT